jgi:hypothetical protein
MATGDPDSWSVLLSLRERILLARKPKRTISRSETNTRLELPIPPLYSATINSDNHKFVGGSATCGGVAQLVRAAES